MPDNEFGQVTMPDIQANTSVPPGNIDTSDPKAIFETMEDSVSGAFEGVEKMDAPSSVGQDKQEDALENSKDAQLFRQFEKIYNQGVDGTASVADLMKDRDDITPDDVGNNLRDFIEEKMAEIDVSWKDLTFENVVERAAERITEIDSARGNRQVFSKEAKGVSDQLVERGGEDRVVYDKNGNVDQGATEFLNAVTLPEERQDSERIDHDAVISTIDLVNAYREYAELYPDSEYLASIKDDIDAMDPVKLADPEMVEAAKQELFSKVGEDGLIRDETGEVDELATEIYTRTTEGILDEEGNRVKGPYDTENENFVHNIIDIHDHYGKDFDMESDLVDSVYDSIVEEPIVYEAGKDFEKQILGEDRYNEKYGSEAQNKNNGSGENKSETKELNSEQLDRFSGVVDSAIGAFRGSADYIQRVVTPSLESNKIPENLKDKAVDSAFEGVDTKSEYEMLDEIIHKYFSETTTPENDHPDQVDLDGDSVDVRFGQIADRIEKEVNTVGDLYRYNESLFENNDLEQPPEVADLDQDDLLNLFNTKDDFDMSELTRMQEDMMNSGIDLTTNDDLERTFHDFEQAFMAGF